MGSTAGERCSSQDRATWEGVATCVVDSHSATPARVGERARCDRAPRDEPDAAGLAEVEDILGGAVGQVVEVLHLAMGTILPRGLDLLALPG